MKIYCSCGQPTVYDLNKPKFCSHCGKSFLESFASTSPPPVRIPAPAFQVPQTVSRPNPPKRRFSNRYEVEDPVYTEEDALALQPVVEFETVGPLRNSTKLETLAYDKTKSDVPIRESKTNRKTKPKKGEALLAEWRQEILGKGNTSEVGE